MRRRRLLGWGLSLGLGILVTGRELMAQGPPPAPLAIPPALEDGSRGREFNQGGSPSPISPDPLPGALAIPASPGGQAGAPINLATALQLGGVRPLDIAAATAGVEQAMGLLLQAKALKLPNLNGGVNYYRHDGANQNLFSGAAFRKDTNALFLGGGPTLNYGLTDAIFSPLAARRVVESRKANVQTARNNSVYNVAQAYFSLQEARGRLGGVQVTSGKADELVNLTRRLAPGLVAPLEYNRALTESLSLRQDLENARRDWRVASARLAEVLLLDQAVVFEPVEPPFLQVALIAEGCPLESLFNVAQANRPELAAQKNLVAAANQLLRREKARPFLPNLIVASPATTSAGGLLPAGAFSAGGNSSLNGSGIRSDFSVGAVWELQGLGFGNAGLIKQRRGEYDQAGVELMRTIYRVNAEVSQGLARLETARARVPLAEEELRQAIESADKNFIGLRETSRPAGDLLRLVVRPQEVVAAIIALNTAYQQYYVAINDANLAHFELYRALGQPGQWVNSRLRQNSPPPPAQP